MLTFILDINLFNFNSGSDAPFWTLSGVLIGAIATGCINYLLQKGQFNHNIEMHRLQNLSKEEAKSYLLELLNHKTYTDRKFSTLRKRTGAFTDDELRLLLTELGAIKGISKNNNEIWYLRTREDERPKPARKGYQ
ncbi:hypothetical protein GCM10011387_31950 [Pedobacter quisquiliarum]|jgi:hypothetical protein|uniref:Uncharacterized protein n=1 Tax=Pedobacter quisquiliarum TaxID=1834438 RepID=A0A916UJV3_9SPHI|nr:hypothetical protein [Pedobacter quisquiliarum]GGC75787.1 hypothetical protein GCM10011387_31950 [Pedobacter quisquiliarum]